MPNFIQNMLPPGVFLAVVTPLVLFAQDSNFIISNDFEPKYESGYIRDEEYKYYEGNCNKRVYHNTAPNHLLVLTENLENHIHINVISESPNPILIIRPVDNIDGENLDICQDYDNHVTEALITYEYQNKVQSDIYQIWVGDTNQDVNATKYDIEITETTSLKY